VRITTTGMKPNQAKAVSNATNDLILKGQLLKNM
jgi:hypothetical protein